VSAKNEFNINVGGALIKAFGKVNTLVLLFYIHPIGHINEFLPRQTRERVVNALVTSRLDSCNSLLHNVVANTF